MISGNCKWALILRNRSLDLNLYILETAFMTNDFPKITLFSKFRVLDTLD